MAKGRSQRRLGALLLASEIYPGVPMSVLTWDEWRILQGLNRSRM
jgi:hypothetical protein